MSEDTNKAQAADAKKSDADAMLQKAAELAGGLAKDAGGVAKEAGVVAKGAVEGAKQAAKASQKAKKEKAAQTPSSKQVKAEMAKKKADERKRVLEAEKLFQEGLASVRDLIAPSSLEIKYDHMRIDGMYAQTFFVYTYPRYIDTNWLSPIVNYDVTMDISQFIYPISSAQIMRTLKNKVAQMQSTIRMNAEKGKVRDPAVQTALEDAEQLRTELQRGQEKFFQFGLYFTIYSDDERELKRASKELQSLLAGKLVLTRRADMRMERGFNSTLPICLDELQTDRNMNTSPLSTTFPFISSELTSDEGILYGLNRHNESLIIFDRFSLENANSVVFAKSGAGKSYAVKLEILRSLMTGSDVIVIDPENEYKPLCDTVGGTYLNVSLNSDRRINPFDLPTPLAEENLKPGDLLRSSVINLTGLMRLMLGELSAQEEGILDKALIDTYATKGITMDVMDPSQYQVPTMEEFYNVLSSMEGAGDMAQRIAKYVNGTYAGVFNKPTNVTLDTGLMVFSVRDLEDELRPVAMYIILNYIWGRVRSTLKRRILVIDEAWSMMQHDDSAKFLFGLVKRARKYYLGVTTITQDVEDFIKSDYGRPIITNSSMQLLLKQSPSAMDALVKMFNLTEGERYMLLNSGVGQGLFFAGLQHVAIQVIASFTEDKIVTTDPEELLAQEAIGAEYESAEQTTPNFELQLETQTQAVASQSAPDPTPTQELVQEPEPHAMQQAHAVGQTEGAVQAEAPLPEEPELQQPTMVEPEASVKPNAQAPIEPQMPLQPQQSQGVYAQAPVQTDISEPAPPQASTEPAAPLPAASQAFDEFVDNSASILEVPIEDQDAGAQGPSEPLSALDRSPEQAAPVEMHIGESGQWVS